MCTTYHSNTTGFYCLPKNQNLRQKWLDACRFENEHTYIRICWKHFKVTDFTTDINIEEWDECPYGFGPLKRNVVPSKNLPENPLQVETNCDLTLGNCGVSYSNT